MPKKTAAVRGGAQRNRPKAQKSIELVRPVSSASPVSDEPKQETNTDAEPTLDSVSTVTASPEIKKTETKQKEARQTETKAGQQSETAQAANTTSTAPKGSAAARLVSRRQAAQRSQQRAAASLITAEHYAYVRRDLIFIAILAAIMFAAIVILQFVPGI